VLNRVRLAVSVWHLNRWNGCGEEALSSVAKEPEERRNNYDATDLDADDQRDFEGENNED
jgi:hypothetical protein